MADLPVDAGGRIPWARVPPHVRQAVERTLGSSVVTTATQPGGFSPGAAVRVGLASGGRAFVKALGVNVHPASFALYRREAEAMPHLPAGLPVPRLLDVYDDGGWIALVYEEVPGWTPALPWRAEDVALVSRALTDLGAALSPTPWPEAPGFAGSNQDLLRPGIEMAADPPPDLDPWLRDRLQRAAATGPDLDRLVGGDVLLHADVRSDNLLLTDAGAVVLDWAWACNGAAWLDVVLFAVTVNVEGGADAEQLVRDHPLSREIPSDAVDALMLAVAAAYWSASRDPSPPSVPGQREFQRAYADATLAWVRRRAGSR